MGSLDTRASEMSSEYHRIYSVITPIRFLISCANRTLTTANLLFLSSLCGDPRAANPAGPQAGRPNSPHRRGNPAQTKDAHCLMPPLSTNRLHRHDHGRALREVLDSAQGIFATCSTRSLDLGGARAPASRRLAHRNAPAQHSGPTQQTPKQAPHKSYVQHEYSARVTFGYRDPVQQGVRIYIMRQFPVRVAPHRRAHPAMWRFAWSSRPCS